MTLSDPARAAHPDATRASNERYLEAVRAASGVPVALYPDGDPAATEATLRRMSGLLLTGGADLDPALYGEAPAGAEEPERDRDALELIAWRAAEARRLPVLGICRGFQAINVFGGGRLVQHLEGHESHGHGDGRVRVHPLRLVPGSRLARILRPTDPANVVLRVNSFHHQAVRADDLAAGLVASGYSPHPDGELVEAFETDEPERFVVGIQCHPERLDSTPPAFARLFAVFVSSARRAALDRPAASDAEARALH